MALGFGRMPAKPEPKPSVVVVPVVRVSRLVQNAISAALSYSDQVIAVHVVTDGPGQRARTDDEIHQEWDEWNPGVPLRVLHTEYAAMAGPILAFVDQLRERKKEQIMVLIPVAVPDRLRYRFLHNHFDLVLSRALRDRSDIITARVPMPLHVPARRGGDAESRLTG